MNQTDSELLEQLRDLHLPDPVSWWPLALGWWIVAAFLLIALSAVCLVLFRARYRILMRDSQKTSLDDLYQQCSSSGATSIYYEKILSLVKHTAMQSGDSSIIVSKLTGDAWVDWMEQATRTSFHENTRIALTISGYQRDPALPDQRTHDEICNWIKQIKKMQIHRFSNQPRWFNAAESEHA